MSSAIRVDIPARARTVNGKASPAKARRPIQLQQYSRPCDIKRNRTARTSPSRQGRKVMEMDRYGYASTSVALITLLLLAIQLQFDSPSPLWG
jgi:hypothetical protein